VRFDGGLVSAGFVSKGAAVALPGYVLSTRLDRVGWTTCVSTDLGSVGGRPRPRYGQFNGLRKTPRTSMRKAFGLGRDPSAGRLRLHATDGTAHEVAAQRIERNQATSFEWTRCLVWEMRRQRRAPPSAIAGRRDERQRARKRPEVPPGVSHCPPQGRMPRERRVPLQGITWRFG